MSAPRRFLSAAETWPAAVHAPAGAVPPSRIGRGFALRSPGHARVLLEETRQPAGFFRSREEIRAAARASSREASLIFGAGALGCVGLALVSFLHFRSAVAAAEHAPAGASTRPCPAGVPCASSLAPAGNSGLASAGCWAVAR